MRTSLNTNEDRVVERRDGEVATAKDRRRVPRWLARLGVAGFVFFLLKGLAWLLIPAALAAYAAKS